MDKKIDRSKKNEIIVNVISIVIILVVIVGFTFGLFGRTLGFYADTDTGSSNVIKFGDLGMTFCDNGNCSSNLSNVDNTLNVDGNSIPTSIDEALEETPYTFELSNTGSLPLTVRIFLESTILADYSGTEETLKNNIYVAIQEQGAGTPTIMLLSELEENLLGTTTLSPNESKIYNVWTWVREDASNTVQGTNLTTRIRVEGEYIPYSMITETTIVTLDNQSATTNGTTSVVATLGNSMPNATAPTKTGYTFGGYYSKTNGQGKQYYSSNMQSVWNWDGSTNTLYAYWICVPTTPNNFTTDTWCTIVSAVQNGNTSTYSVGNTKTVSLTGLGTHTLRIANLGDDDPNECSPSNTTFSKTACGFVLEFADIITNHAMRTDTRTNAGGWPTLTTQGGATDGMREYLNTTIYKSLPNDLRLGIIDTYVISGHGSSDSANFTSTDKLYLLSCVEVYGNNCNNLDTVTTNETKQLKYYESMNVLNGNYEPIIKQYNGYNEYWYTRSPHHDVSTHYLLFDKKPRMWNASYTENNYGVSPAFRIG